MTKKILFCFGFGYSCAHLAQMIQEKYPDEWEIRGTTRDPEKRDYYRDKGVKLYLHDALSPSMDMASRLEEATHILISAPPDKEGDPVFRAYADGGKEVDTQFGEVHINKNAEGLILCSIRPEHLGIAKAEFEEDCGTIIGREFRGHDITYYVLFRGDRYIVHTDNRNIFELDDKVIMKPLEKAIVLEQNKAIQ